MSKPVEGNQLPKGVKSIMKMHNCHLPPLAVLTSFIRRTISVQEAAISEELLSFLNSAFTNQLSKEVWTNIMEQYPDIKGTAEFLVSPVMQTGMKDDIKGAHGFTKTKDLFTFDLLFDH